MSEPTPLSAEEFKKLWADVQERMRPYREEAERQERPLSPNRGRHEARRTGRHRLFRFRGHHDRHRWVVAVCEVPGGEVSVTEHSFA